MSEAVDKGDNGTHINANNLNDAVLQHGEGSTHCSQLQGDKGHIDNTPSELISVPEGRMKTDTTVSSDADLEHLFLTLEYWLSSALPNEVVRFCLQNSPAQSGAVETGTESKEGGDKSTISALLELLERFDHLEQLGALITITKSRSIYGKLIAAVEAGDLSIFQMVHTVCAGEERSCLHPDMCETAADRGHLDCLAYLIENGCEVTRRAGYGAAKNGHVECLRLSLENGCRIDRNTSLFAAKGGHLHCLELLLSHNCPLSEKSASAAARGGFLDCLKRIRKAGCRLLPEVCEISAGKGHLPCLQFAFEHGCEWDKGTCYAAAQSGSLECLRFAHENRCEWDNTHKICVLASSKGHFRCLEYAHKHGCSLDSTDICSNAAHWTSIEMMRYAFERGAPLSTEALLVAASRSNASAGEDVAVLRFCCENGPEFISKGGSDLLKCAVKAGNLPIFEYLVTLQLFENTWKDTICDSAAVEGQLAILQFARTHGAPWGVKTIAVAARKGHLECLQYLQENGCPHDETVCSEAATMGQLDCLEYAHEQGFPWDEGTCAVAAERSRFPCLRYAHEYGCPWDARVCASAAKNRNLEMLTYAHEHGCPWDARVCATAAKNRDLKMLTYAHEYGCPWDARVCAIAALNRDLKMLTYAHEHGCPWDEKTCANAAAECIECLIYAHEHGCPWDAKTCTAAAGNKNFKYLRMNHYSLFNPPRGHQSRVTYLERMEQALAYAHEHGCPWNESACVAAVRQGNLAQLTYLHEHGCRWGKATTKAAGKIEVDHSIGQYLFDKDCPGWRDFRDDHYEIY